MSRYCGIPWTSLLGGPFSYLANHSAENKARGSVLIWEVTSSVFKAIGNGLLLGLLSRSYLSLCFLLYYLWLRSRSAELSPSGTVEMTAGLSED